MENIVEVSNLSVKIGHRYLLKDINWQVKVGEHWSVFGLNGSGKTTLLNIIAGYQTATTGDVMVFGQKLQGENILALRKQIGWVSASFYDKIYHKEAVLNIVLSGKCGTLGVRYDISDEDVKRTLKILKVLRLEDKINRSFSTLSKGERQNVLLARAFLAKPKLLILDEPCTGLDVCGRAGLFSLVEQLADLEDMTIIYVTHHVDEILPLFQKALFLKQGQIIAKGNADEIFSQDVFSRLIGQEARITQDQQGIRRVSITNISDDALSLKEVWGL